jgi:multidrug transporter EmrE-like cation transporter
MNYLFLVAAVVLNVAAYAMFRAIANRPHDPTWMLLFAIGLGLGAANLFFFTSALRQMTLAIAYPLFSGATIALMVLAGALFFGERISATMIVGCGVIVLGIALVARQ